ncbi:MAG: plasmid replication protein, CyRepA1 family, partial [Cyanobacteriota bacterium]|nr:plasmid replication protein, CyRepA1 family [Cyanobacteriota bacterium]
AAAGAAEVLVGACPGPHKGADDHLAAGGSWEQLAAALQPLQPAAVVPALRRADRIAPAGVYLGVSCPLPEASEERLVALRAAMGCGKTEAIAAAVAPLLHAGVRVVLITHRRGLGAALAERLGLPWADEAAPGCDLRQVGIALCVDSLCSGSALQFRAADWADAVVVADEAAQVLAHALMATGTAIAKRRPQVLEQLTLLLQGARQVVVADAQLNNAVLEALEAATGRRALLIDSAHQPAAGRRLVAHSNRNSWRLALEQQLRRRRRLWITTTAQQAKAANSARNLALLVQQLWPGARVLVVDSETSSDPSHPASELTSAPDRIAAEFDVVIATPAVDAGLSVTLEGHFDAVFAWAGGTTNAVGVVQALARVRAGCDRHLYAPLRSPGGELQIGSGDTDPAAVLRRLREHETAAIAQLLAAGGWNPTTNTTGPWLPCWAQLAAIQNGQRLAYRATVLALLEREGYRIETPADLAPDEQAAARQISETLKAIAAEAQAAEDQALQATELISDQEAAELAKRRRLAASDQAKLHRHAIAKAWGLGAAPPSQELLEAERDGLRRRLRFGWMVRSADARQLVARADLAAAQAISHNGQSWAPDLCREVTGPRLQAADALGLPLWLERGERGEWFGADDAQLQQLQAVAIAHARSITQVLGLSPGQRATTTLRQLLAAAGYRLEAKRCRSGQGRTAAASYRYRVVRLALPAGADWAAMEDRWHHELQQRAEGCVPKPANQ